MRLRKVAEGVLIEAVLDIPEWFAEMDRAAVEPFMEDRAQPDTPIRSVFE